MILHFRTSRSAKRVMIIYFTCFEVKKDDKIQKVNRIEVNYIEVNYIEVNYIEVNFIDRSCNYDVDIIRMFKERTFNLRYLGAA